MTPAATFPAGTPIAGTRPGANPQLQLPVKTTLVITRQCNLDCRLCYGNCKAQSAAPELSIDAWRTVADDLAGNGVIWLYIEGGEPFLKEASMAKLKASRLAMSAASEAVQIHGGLGYMVESPVARFYCDAKVLEIGEGTNEIQHVVIARELGC